MPGRHAVGTGANPLTAMRPANPAAIIINCSTKEQTTLALVSLLAHADIPVTVVDCESTDGSLEFFRVLQRRLDFELVSLPLAPHGATLDRLFLATRHDALLLLDSDAEVLRDDLVPALEAGLATEAWGSGFLHRGEWLATNHLVAGNIGYYAPRMWIPCTMLAVSPIRRALAAGASFRACTRGNEIPRFPTLSWLLTLRFRVPPLDRLRLDAFAPLRREYFGERPHYVYFDTGSLVYDRLSRIDGLPFAALDDALWPLSVRHWHGVTRRRLRSRMRNATDAEATRSEAVARIESVYAIGVPELRRGLAGTAA